MTLRARRLKRAKSCLTMPGRVFHAPHRKSAGGTAPRPRLFARRRAARPGTCLRRSWSGRKRSLTTRLAFLAASMARRRLGYALEDGRLEEESEVHRRSALESRDPAGRRRPKHRRPPGSRARRNVCAQAIENGATDDEIAQLMQELREAMAGLHGRTGARGAARSGERPAATAAATGRRTAAADPAGS